MHTIQARATDGLSHRACQTVTVNVGPNAKGDWVGGYGHNGYVMGAWFDNTATGDRSSLPAGVSLSLLQGLRSAAGVQTSVRALEDWDESERRVGAWYHATQLKLRLDFASAYAGTLHLYAIDWSTTARRRSTRWPMARRPRRSTSRRPSIRAPGCTSRSASRLAATSTSRPTERRAPTSS